MAKTIDHRMITRLSNITGLSKLQALRKLKEHHGNICDAYAAIQADVALARAEEEADDALAQAGEEADDAPAHAEEEADDALAQADEEDDDALAHAEEETDEIMIQDEISTDPHKEVKGVDDPQASEEGKPESAEEKARMDLNETVKLH